MSRWKDLESKEIVMPTIQEALRDFAEYAALSQIRRNFLKKIVKIRRGKNR